MILNRKRAEEKMSEHGIEALIATSAANVFYTTDSRTARATRAHLEVVNSQGV